jgi:ADP-ribosylglycohydrolase
MPAENCREYVDMELKAGDVTQYQAGPFRFGQYTDDTQLAREFLQSYVEHGRFDPEDYARRIAAIFREGRIVGRGRATELAAMRLMDGEPWDQAGTPAPSAGNGSAMRAGPVGLVCFDDMDALRHTAHDQGRITHQDPRCSAGATAVAGAVAFALTGRPLDPHEHCEALSGLVAPFETVFTQALLDLRDWVELPEEEAVGPISRVGLDPGFGGGWSNISPFVVGSVLWSLYAFLRTPGEYWKTICTAIAAGGDVDTTAAMAGAISGAYNGEEALPKRLVKCLNDQGTWTAPELRELAFSARRKKCGVAE